LVRQSLSFNSKGGSSVSAVSFTSGMTIASAPKAPTRSGYTFAGWSLVDDERVISFPYTLSTNQDVTLEANWLANTYKVTFNSKGGSAVSASSFTTGGSIDSPSVPTRAGYTFTGWSTSDGGSAVSFPYSPGTIQDVRLYANWTVNSYTVNFNSMGGSSVNAATFTTGGTVAAPSAPTRTGYLFAGWSTSETGTFVKFPYRPAVTQDVTLFAKWTVLVPKLNILTSDSLVGGSTIPVQISGVKPGFLGYLQWSSPANVSPLFSFAGENGSTDVLNFATPSIAGTYKLFIDIWTGWDSPLIPLSKTVVIGKSVGIVAKVSSNNPLASKSTITVSGATKFGGSLVASKTLSVSLMRNGNVVAVTEATTDSSGLFSVTLPGNSYQAGDYTALVSFAADTQYLATSATTAKLALR